MGFSILEPLLSSYVVSGIFVLSYCLGLFTA